MTICFILLGLQVVLFSPWPKYLIAKIINKTCTLYKTRSWSGSLFCSSDEKCVALRTYTSLGSYTVKIFFSNELTSVVHRESNITVQYRFARREDQLTLARRPRNCMAVQCNKSSYFVYRTFVIIVQCFGSL